MLLKMLQVLEAIQRGHQARAVGRSGGSKLDDGSGVGMHFACCVQLLKQATPRNRYTEHTNACVSVAPMRWNVLESIGISTDCELLHEKWGGGQMVMKVEDGNARESKASRHAAEDV